MQAIKALLVAFVVLLGFGCAHPADQEADEEDEALRALREGDTDIAVPLGISQDGTKVLSVPAQNAPAKFHDVASWRVDYVDIKDDRPEDAYRGLMLFANDATGKTLYLLPIAMKGTDVGVALFNATPASGSDVLTPVTWDPQSPDSAEALHWIVSEQRRLGELVDKAQAASPTKHASKYAQYECIVHVAVFLLAWSNPVIYLVADGATDVAFGFLDGNHEAIAQGGIKAGLFGGLFAALKKIGGKLAQGVGAVAMFAGTATYHIYHEGFRNGLVSTAKELVPESCMDSGLF